MPRPANSRTLGFEQLEDRKLLDGTNFYVSTTGNNSNDGLTPATAWRSVLRATQNGSLLPGDTINILPGLYTDDGVNTLVDGTAAEPITVRADGGPVTIQGGVTSNSWTLYNAANNVYVLDVDSLGIYPYWTFCAYTSTAFGYGAMTNIGDTFQGTLPDPAGNYNFNSDPSCMSQLFDPPAELVDKCFFYWTGSTVGNYVSGTKIYLHAPLGWTQQDVCANVAIGDASKDIIASNNYWNFDGLNIRDSYDGFLVWGNNVTITNCTVEDIYNQSCLGSADNLTFDHNLVQSVGPEYTPVATESPAITVSSSTGPQALQFGHGDAGDLEVTAVQDGQDIGPFALSPSQTLSDLAGFLQGLGFTASVVGSGSQSCQFLLNSGQVDVSTPETFQSASWSLVYPFGSWYHGIYFGGDNSVISNSVFKDINGNGISYRYGNNFTIDGNIIDNDLGGMLNAGGSNITIYNNVFCSTVDAGQGINLGYGGNGSTIEFEQDTVAASNRDLSGFFETAGGSGCPAWALADNVYVNVLSSDSAPTEEYISATPDATLATWKLYDNDYWDGNASGTASSFEVFLLRLTNGEANPQLYQSWSAYLEATGALWGWEQGSVNVDPELDANYVPQNPVVAAMGIGAVVQNSATWNSTSGGEWNDRDLWNESLVGPLLPPGVAPRPGDTDTASFDAANATGVIDLSDASPSLAALNLSASDYTLSGGNLTLNGDSGPALVTVGSALQTIESSVNLATDVDLTVTHTLDQLTISGPISGNGQLVKEGDGSLVLGGANTATGGIEIDAGAVIVTTSQGLADGSSLIVGNAAAFATESPPSSDAVTDAVPAVATAVEQAQSVAPALADVVLATTVFGPPSKSRAKASTPTLPLFALAAPSLPSARGDPAEPRSHSSLLVWSASSLEASLAAPPNPKLPVTASARALWAAGVRFVSGNWNAAAAQNIPFVHGPPRFSQLPGTPPAGGYLSRIDLPQALFDLGFQQSRSAGQGFRIPVGGALLQPPLYQSLLLLRQVPPGVGRFNLLARIGRLREILGRRRAD